MHRFYQDKSSLIYGEGLEPVELATGLDAIKSKFSERANRRWVISLENGSVDAQQSRGGGVMLMVTGTITSKASRQPRHFVQSFFLAEHNATSYYLLNDTFRIIDIPIPSSIVSPQENKIIKSDEKKKKVKNKKDEVDPSQKQSEEGKIEQVQKEKIETSLPTPTVSTIEPKTQAHIDVKEQQPQENQLKEKEKEQVVKKPFSWANLVKDSSGSVSNQSAPNSVGPPQQQQKTSNVKKKQSQSSVSGKNTSTNPPKGESLNKTENNGKDDNKGSAKETELERKARKLKAVVSPEEMPSTAIFVKNLDIYTVEDELREVLLPFMTEPDPERLLIAEQYDRGFAFIDLGSQEAVARAVSASRSNEGIKLKKKNAAVSSSSLTLPENGHDEGSNQQVKKLFIEPSNKPVRPSGLKAINERRGSNSSNGSTPTTSPQVTSNKGFAAAALGGGGGGGGRFNYVQKSKGGKEGNISKK
eukprot:CAMPEP_0114345830 /NCGR_PEP_ID=MMETSP0101-20121206/12576_1 /TAXON_ID=38822 ORGANISM="Pteridomonas danica, Strain PT" /NCGR_SAMPLE_ID=MMETSP0101 /ASSEMBLY_ACC=CAM_ASM_000211 /LENGTH=471 /DNA_ID=CAMNT_0001482099 /DNA_START=176 /DNA_END=1591 /DNA_ORIENTATION=-